MLVTILDQYWSETLANVRPILALTDIGIILVPSHIGLHWSNEQIRHVTWRAYFYGVTRPCPRGGAPVRFCGFFLFFCASDSPAAYGALQMCFDWLIEHWTNIQPICNQYYLPSDFSRSPCRHWLPFIRLDALAKALSVIATATWLAGWLGGWLGAGCPSHSGIVSKRLNLSENFFDHLKAPSF